MRDISIKWKILFMNYQKNLKKNSYGTKNCQI